ncbi:MAG: UDP-N-acetylmuramate--L-alanine ligase [Candidatus Krumholzibacteriota bacterium]|nr:UDP-N-acetylmuramate--L-alanine ligase [Candidatus Krumholzibacteriota bacterium]
MIGKENKIHFVGIGGIGMSGIAEVLLNLGFEVSGSDLERTAITARLESLGATVFIGHRAENIRGAQVVVISSAIRPSNPEVKAAKEEELPLIPRSDMLGELMRMRTGIAVAGAHGKTTTTSLAAVVLQEAGLDPTIVVGGKVKSLRTNARLGEGKYLVAEVDESDGNFVRLAPVYSIITNIDAEHLDFYGSMENIYEAFIRFASQVPFNGAVICCLDDPHVRAVLPRIERRVLTYGFDHEADMRGEIIGIREEGTSFTLFAGGREEGELFLRLPGKHNVLNALAVCALASELGIGLPPVKKALASFEGIGRRFEFKGEAAGIMVIDDYGHHPTEVKAAIETARNCYDRRLVVIFQPHRYTRTRDLHQRFDKCFLAADEVFIGSIYPAGEHSLPGISGELIYRAALRGGARKVSYLPDREHLRSEVLRTVKAGDIVLTLGAGDIFLLGEELLKIKGGEGP